MSLVDVKTSPCPRCGSFQTRMIGDANSQDTIHVLVRHCLSCRWKWDYTPQFAPRKGPRQDPKTKDVR